MNIRLGKCGILLIIAAAVAGCSSGGSSGGTVGSNGSGGNGDATTLQIVTPKIIYSKTAGISSGYVTVINPTSTTIKNLSYSLNNPIGSGSSATIDSASAANCAVIAANSQCNIKLDVAAAAVAGSFGFSASNDGVHYWQK